MHSPRQDPHPCSCASSRVACRRPYCKAELPLVHECLLDHGSQPKASVFRTPFMKHCERRYDWFLTYCEGDAASSWPSASGCSATTVSREVPLPFAELDFHRFRFLLALGSRRAAEVATWTQDVVEKPLDSNPKDLGDQRGQRRAWALFAWPCPLADSYLACAPFAQRDPWEDVRMRRRA